MLDNGYGDSFITLCFMNCMKKAICNYICYILAMLIF